MAKITLAELKYLVSKLPENKERVLLENLLEEDLQSEKNGFGVLLTYPSDKYEYNSGEIVRYVENKERNCLQLSPYRRIENWPDSLEKDLDRVSGMIVLASSKQYLPKLIIDLLEKAELRKIPICLIVYDLKKIKDSTVFMGQARGIVDQHLDQSNLTLCFFDESADHVPITASKLVESLDSMLDSDQAESGYRSLNISEKRADTIRKYLVARRSWYISFLKARQEDKKLLRDLEDSTSTHAKVQFFKAGEHLNELGDAISKYDWQSGIVEILQDEDIANKQGTLQKAVRYLVEKVVIAKYEGRKQAICNVVNVIKDSAAADLRKVLLTLEVPNAEQVKKSVDDRVEDLFQVFLHQMIIDIDQAIDHASSDIALDGVVLQFLSLLNGDYKELLEEIFKETENDKESESSDEDSKLSRNLLEILKKLKENIESDSGKTAEDAPEKDDDHLKKMVIDTSREGLMSLLASRIAAEIEGAIEVCVSGLADQLRLVENNYEQRLVGEIRSSYAVVEKSIETTIEDAKMSMRTIEYSMKILQNE